MADSKEQAGLYTSSVLSLTFHECDHLKETKNIIAPFNNYRTFIDIFNEYHDFKLKNNQCKVMSKSHEVTPALSVGEVVTLFNVRQFTFTCESGPPTEVEFLSNCINVASEKADKKAVNAFELMMAGGRTFPPKKTSR